MELHPGPSPKQYDIDDPRQLFSPEELEVGMHVGLVAIRGISLATRVRTTHLILRDLMRNGYGTVRELAEPWDTQASFNTVYAAELHGRVTEIKGNGAVILPYGVRTQDTPKQLDSFDVLPLPTDELIEKSFPEMGLASKAGNPTRPHEIYIPDRSTLQKPWLPYDILNLS